MARKVSIGLQDFREIIANKYFYIDKTSFIREWWEAGDSVTLIARPRRFGKTLNMNMLERFFSVKYAGQKELFQGLSIWEEKKYQDLQGTYPVIALSFAHVKGGSYQTAREQICQLITKLYLQHSFLKQCDWMEEGERAFFDNVRPDMSDAVAAMAIHNLCDFLCRRYEKKPIILLDEYDTPMQTAYMGGYLDEMLYFLRSLFCSTFKVNPYMDRALITGMTGIGLDPHFSDLNYVEEVATNSRRYLTSFGFTEDEVQGALDAHELSDGMSQVSRWYDGSVFGWPEDIYNPWFILNHLSKGDVRAYWDDMRQNALVGKLLREGSRQIKEDLESLLRGESIWTPIEEQAVYCRLGQYESAIWSLLFATGYLKALSRERADLVASGKARYELSVTNREVRRMFEIMILDWFQEARSGYNDFVKALLLGDVDAMNDYMTRVAMKTFSYFDTGKSPSEAEPERFYHGFVLGLMVDLQDRYAITSNRESGFGRYDVMMEPKNPEADAILMEFKVRNARRERTLEDTVAAALCQIEEKQYGAQLMAKGIPESRIRSYGFAFEGKDVLIGDGS